nr:hypothetical protein DGKKSRWO_DGKKSRWO_CDS_0173 [uncultured phage]CAI9752352.1 hypothetical protein CVNMHQAP_CVNMHQAP_CDS_0175 [uncultured phage]
MAEEIILTEENGLVEAELEDLSDDTLPEDMQLEFDNGKGEDE